MDRDILWDRMRGAGYGGKILRLIQSLYEGSEGSFRLGGIRGRRMAMMRGYKAGQDTENYVEGNTEEETGDQRQEKYDSNNWWEW